MNFRLFREEDLPKLERIHRKVDYGFTLPQIEVSGVGLVIEENGEVVGYVGAEQHAELFGVFDPEWGTPGERMLTFADLHLPIAEQLKERGVKVAYVAIDPKFKSFGRRLSRLGWKKALWENFFMSVDECISALKRKVA